MYWELRGLPELLALWSCGRKLCVCFLSRCDHRVQCWAHSAFLGDQHWRAELGDVTGHWQVALVFGLCSSLCHGGLQRRKGSPTLDLCYGNILDVRFPK